MESLKTRFDFPSPVIQAQVSCLLMAKLDGDMGSKFVLFTSVTCVVANPVHLVNSV